MSQRRRSLLLLGVLAMSAAGCELVANFDRSEIDAGPLVEPDEDAGDSSAADGSTKDTNQPDTTVPDAGADTNQPDTNAGDTNPGDTNVPDTNVPDTNEPDAHDAGPDAHDANVPDTNVPDTNVPDTNVPDTNLPDTNLPDTNLPDTNLPDTNLPDTNLPDTNQPDAACNSLDPSVAPVVTVADSASAAPTFSGGTFPTSGTWYLTDLTYYSSGTTHTGTYHQVFVLSGTTYDLAETVNGALDSETDDISLVDTSAGTFTTTSTCGGSGVILWKYVSSGSGAGATLQASPDGVAVYTYTQQ